MNTIIKMFIGVDKTDAEYEEAIKNSKGMLKAQHELYYACLKDKTLTENFDLFFQKAKQILKNNKININLKTHLFLPRIIFFLKSSTLYNSIIEYAEGTNIFINTFYLFRNIWKIDDKKKLMEIINITLQSYDFKRRGNYHYYLIEFIKNNKDKFDQNEYNELMSKI